MLEAINAAGGQLPKDLPSPPTFRKVNPADSPILLISASTRTPLPLTEVDDHVQTKLVQQISQIPGVAQVMIGGQQTPSIRIQLDPAKLVAKNLSLEEVRPALTAATTDDPKGTIYSGKRAFTIYANDQITHAEPWNDVIVAYRNGGALRVATSGRRSRDRRTRRRPDGPTASAPSSSSSSNSPAPTSSTPSTRSWRNCRASRRRCRRRSISRW